MSLSPLLRDLRALRPRLEARLCAVGKHRRNLKFEESAGPRDAPGPGNLGRDQGGGAGRDGGASVRLQRGAYGGGGSERCQPVTVDDTAREAAQPRERVAGTLGGDAGAKRETQRGSVCL